MRERRAPARACGAPPQPWAAPAGGAGHAMARVRRWAMLLLAPESPPQDSPLVARRRTRSSARAQRCFTEGRAPIPSACSRVNRKVRGRPSPRRLKARVTSEVARRRRRPRPRPQPGDPARCPGRARTRLLPGANRPGSSLFARCTTSTKSGTVMTCSPWRWRSRPRPPCRSGAAAARPALTSSTSATVALVIMFGCLTRSQG